MSKAQATQTDYRPVAGQWIAHRLRVPSSETCVAVTLSCAVLFNAALAILNAHFHVISRGDVIAAEVAIVIVAALICVVCANRLMIPWLAVLWLLATILILTSLDQQAFTAKYYRDVLLIPMFVALGMTFAKGNIIRLIGVLQSIILAVMLVEAFWPEAFVSIFSPWSYYVNTRGFAVEDNWHPELGLYLSSLRPHGRIIGEFLGIHRLSSIFLEPVSLGNWAVIIAIFTSTLWGEMSWPTRMFFILTNLLLLLGCDGRLAFVAVLLISVVSLAADRLPKYIYFSYLPCTIAAAIALAAVYGPDRGADDFINRVVSSANVLTSLDLFAVLGVSQNLASLTADSGISYLIVTQSIFGFILLWGAICFLQPPTNREATVLIHGVCIYVALLLIVSYSLFSIKSAALLWFIYGYVRARAFIEVKTKRMLAISQ